MSTCPHVTVRNTRAALALHPSGMTYIPLFYVVHQISAIMKIWVYPFWHDVFEWMVWKKKTISTTARKELSSDLSCCGDGLAGI